MAFLPLPGWAFSPFLWVTRDVWFIFCLFPCLPHTPVLLFALFYIISLSLWFGFSPYLNSRGFSIILFAFQILYLFVPPGMGGRRLGVAVVVQRFGLTITGFVCLCFTHSGWQKQELFRADCVNPMHIH